MRRDGLTDEEAAARGLPPEEDSAGPKTAVDQTSVDQPYTDADTKVIVHHHDFDPLQESVEALRRLSEANARIDGRL
jgi:hypothetical protein